MTESELKTKFCELLRRDGHYGRRYEDQFAVGIPDMICIVRDCPVFFIEAKIIRSRSWGATPRQAEELKRIRDAAGDQAYACELGYHVEEKSIHIRRIGDDKMWSYAINQWSRFSPAFFLSTAHKIWSDSNGQS